jgi:phage shock protein PspC (stress-responsive transcriptional regulator)
VFFRLMFLFSLLFGGLGAIAYLLMWIMVPERPAAEGAPRPARRLHLSDTDRKIAGVCGGLGEWLEVDPVLFRVAFVLLAFVGGLGVFAYIVLWLLIPRGHSLPGSSGTASQAPSSG